MAEVNTATSAVMKANDTAHQRNTGGTHTSAASKTNKTPVKQDTADDETTPDDKTPDGEMTPDDPADDGQEVGVEEDEDESACNKPPAEGPEVRDEEEKTSNNEDAAQAAVVDLSTPLLTPPVTMQATFESLVNHQPLPDEIKILIGKFAASDDSEGQTLFALRGVCRDLENVTFDLFGETFFTKRSVVFFKRSLARLTNIAKSARFSRFVKTVVVGPHRLLSAEELQKFDDSWDPSAEIGYPVFQSDELHEEVVKQLKSDFSSLDHASTH